MPDATLKNAPTACDPVTLEIVRGAVRAAQAEMEALIERTAISAFIREKKDFYTALFDADGVMAVGSNLPVFGDICGPVFRDFPPDTMRPGDLYWYNDCYGSRGAISHSNDQVLLAPVFHDGRRCGFVMGWAHFSDIGGLRAGSISPDTTDIFQEGIIVPPTKLIDAGVTNEGTLKIFFRNSRFPEQNVGDMRALMASAALGVKRIEEIAARFGTDVLADGLRQLVARTRNLVRTKLAETFDYGTHRFTDAIDSDGHGNGPFHLRLALTRERGPDGEDRFIFDATATDDQSPGPVNLLLNPDVPGTALSMFYLGGDPAQVCNAGGPQALDEVRLREGSLLWPKFPAPLGMRGLTLMRFLAAVNGLINVAGGKAPAAHSAYVISFLRGTFRNDKGELEPFLMSDGIGVGWGARPYADGTDAVYFVAQENYPVEFLETGYPVRLRTYGILVDSCGAGPLSRRLRHRARVRHPGRGSRARRAHRQRQEPAVGHRWRHGGRHRPRRGQSRHQPRARAGAVVGRQRAEAWRRAAHRDRRRRRPWPSLRPAARDGGRGRGRRLRDRRHRAAALWRRPRRRRGRQGRHRQAARQAAGDQGVPPPRLCRQPWLTHRSRSPSTSAAPSPTSPCTTPRAARSGAPRRRACRPIPARPFWPACDWPWKTPAARRRRWAACCTARPSPPT